MEINESHPNKSGGYLFRACYSKGLCHQHLKRPKGRHRTGKALSLKRRERKEGEKGRNFEKEGFRHVLISGWLGEDTARVSVLK